jgi:hypothetical protein
MTPNLQAITGSPVARLISTAAIVAGTLVACASAPTEPPAPVDSVASSAVPEPFWDFDPNSAYTINYSDIDTILRAVVVDVGRSNRQKLPATHAQTGTRLRTKVKRETANEANRVHFAEAAGNPEFRQVLRDVRLKLEGIPNEVPLKQFSRDEQLAYWLNLYNITVLDQLVTIFPERNLKKEITGRHTFFTEKTMNVAGIPLSLDDIQHTILRWNYDDNPLVIYGLYQGNIGSPNIRRWAYRGDTVYKDLQDNAEDFVNSNRGTSASTGTTFDVSSYYERNRAYFPNWDTDLKEHLMRYIEGAQKQQLAQADRLDPDINDWTITDVYSTEQQITGSFAHNRAAMLGSVTSQQPSDGGGLTPTGFTVDVLTVSAQDPQLSRIRKAVTIQPSKVESTKLDSAEGVTPVNNAQDNASKPAAEATPAEEQADDSEKG